jgi:hypothetical protein
MPNFIPTKLEEERAKEKDSTFTIWLNEEETLMLNRFKKVLEQPKNSTAFKTLARIGMLTLDEPKIAEIVTVLFKNKKNNKRIGVAEFED